MYSYMVVDDDRLVRERILSLIPAEKYELSLCGEAENGMEAIELFEQCTPQIVILDIQIPIYNGIEVAQEILKLEPDTKIIIITGFGTTENAQGALRSGAVDYLLKPINPEELDSVLKRITDQLNLETAEMLEKQRMERLLEREMPVIKDRFLMSLLESKAADDSYLQYLEDLGIPSKPENICVSVISPNYSEIGPEKQLSMQAILEESFSKELSNSGISSVYVYDSMQRMIVIASGDSNSLDSRMERTASIIHDKIKYLYRFDFHASVGSTVSDIRDIGDSYKNALHALEYWQVLGNNGIVNSKNILYIEKPSKSVPTPAYSDIMELIISEQVDSICDMAEAFISKLTFATRHSLHFTQQKSIELMSLILAVAQEIGIDTSYIYESGESVYVDILNADTVFKIQDIMNLTIHELIEKIHEKRKNSKNRALRSAMEYVMNHFQNPSLDISEVAEHVQLSPNYLAQLYKRYENMSFTEYLNRVRIEHAKKLLMTTHLRVYEVSEAVGFQNSKYFFQIFKQLTGMRPREYYENVISKS